MGNTYFAGVQKDTFDIRSVRLLPHGSRKEKTVPNLIAVNEDLTNSARLLGHYQQIGQKLFDLDLLAELQHFGACHLSDRFFA